MSLSLGLPRGGHGLNVVWGRALHGCHVLTRRLGACVRPLPPPSSFPRPRVGFQWRSYVVYLLLPPPPFPARPYTARLTVHRNRVDARFRPTTRASSSRFLFRSLAPGRGGGELTNFPVRCGKRTGGTEDKRGQDQKRRPHGKERPDTLGVGPSWRAKPRAFAMERLKTRCQPFASQTELLGPSVFGRPGKACFCPVSRRPLLRLFFSLRDNRAWRNWEGVIGRTFVSLPPSHLPRKRQWRCRPVSR
jgi:hypothetical protein